MSQALENDISREVWKVYKLSLIHIYENHVPIPSLLAVSALQQYLVRTKKRTSVALILESGEPRAVSYTHLSITQKKHIPRVCIFMMICR